MTRFRTIVKGQNPDGSWMDPVDLRCVGGPADGKWFSEPPEGYRRMEVRGGACWTTGWCGTCANGGIVAIFAAPRLITYPHALPDEHP